MGDPANEIDLGEVLQFIFAPVNKHRRIWSPGTTLEAMGIEQYPHHPPILYREMRKILEYLHSQGHLQKRPRLHSHFTMNEVAYERSASSPQESTDGI